LASVLVLPIVMMDVLRLSNRFVGPVTRLRAGMKDLAAGRPVKPLNFRNDDYWRELAVDFNEAAARVRAANPTEIVDYGAAGNAECRMRNAECRAAETP
jgi:hypothetical protein